MTSLPDTEPQPQPQPQPQWLLAPRSTVDAAVCGWWQGLSTPPHTLAVALSSGADSTALLMAVWRMVLQAWQRDASALPRRVVALHVHHGLQDAADDFEQTGAQLCERLVHEAAMSATAAPLLGNPAGTADGGILAGDGASGFSLDGRLVWRSARVTVALVAGDSLEARAREERYAALARMAQEEGAGMVLLGQHADDQAESVLLALSRGAGVAGLAGMGTAFTRQGSAFARPLLEVPGQLLRDWLRELQIPWQEDPSNADLRFTRNRFRHQLFPVLEQAMPAFRTSFARSARLAAEADQLLGELAQLDLLAVGDPPSIRPLQALGRARQANVLRWWLKQRHGVVGSEAQMRALQDVLAACTTRGHRIHIRVGAGYVQRRDACLDWVPLHLGTIKGCPSSS
ncbi:tRNA lysidine(34) synthetase TilS [Brachymonas denitrificans]|uniref:tRNA lysidine(34) synthetase TilS n=1 Tax=Brachymonas denitrificans TaxID=28220 RepID=UPI001BD11D66|nr:tRNA lysidine(34) synthetase TilS [Brachymonas denitrificans]